MIDLLGIRDLLLEDGVFLSFNGFFSQDIIAYLGNVAEVHFTDQKKERIFFSIFSVLTEQMQNAIKYSYCCSSDIGCIAIVGFSKKRNKYFVATGNYINFNDKEKIKERIENVNSLSKIEIRKLYREKRRSGEHKHKKGAGLGFLEIAKQSTEPLQYRIDKIDNTKHFFQLYSYI